LPFFVEALCRTTQVVLAWDLLKPYEELANKLDLRSAQAQSAGCRGLLAAAEGDEAASIAAFDESLGYYLSGDWYPFERARTLLLKGQVQRRFRRRGAANETLLIARQAFERLGCPGWVEKVDAEMARLGLRRAPTDLTDGESAGWPSWRLRA
jgi:hypothetical protein